MLRKFNQVKDTRNRVNYKYVFHVITFFNSLHTYLKKAEREQKKWISHEDKPTNIVGSSLPKYWMTQHEDNSVNQIIKLMI